MNYYVGQILFVVLNKKIQIYPMMVVEEIIKKTLSGEDVNYVLQAGSDSSRKILLNEIDGEIFESADEAKHVLTSKATLQIEKLVDSAALKAQEWYSHDGNEETKQEIMSLSSDVPTETNKVTKVELPDGTIANLKNFEVATG